MLIPIVSHRHLLLRLIAITRQCFPWAGRNGICEGNRRRIVVANSSSDGRDDNHHDGAHGSEHDGPEVGGLLAGCPLDEADGVGPESGCDGDDHFEGFKLIDPIYVVKEEI